ncbi:hypothetical protein Tco_1228464 [Tanacetum coccineum]
MMAATPPPNTTDPPHHHLYHAIIPRQPPTSSRHHPLLVTAGRYPTTITSPRPPHYRHLHSTTKGVLALLGTTKGAFGSTDHPQGTKGAFGLVTTLNEVYGFGFSSKGAFGLAVSQHRVHLVGCETT